MNPTILPVEKLSMVINTMQTFFENRVRSRYNRNITLKTKVDKYNLSLIFKDEKAHTNVLTIPLPFLEDGVVFIKTNKTYRAVGSFYIMEEDKELQYIDLMLSLLKETSSENYMTRYFSPKGPFLQKIIGSFKYENTTAIIKSLQRIINDIIYRLPVHETMMNSWAMNKRVWVIDPEFDLITDPREQLEYQKRKSDKFFDRGWTMMGLADGVLAGKNYILKTSLRKTIPFGLHFHNPQRNLYSTLGMKGDEKAFINSQTGKELETQGIYRSGWNLFTLFVDTKDVWEDQILVDESVANLFTEKQRKYVCFGTVVVEKDQVLEDKDVLCVNEDKSVQRIKLKADKIVVDSVTEEEENIGGILSKVTYVTVTYRRFIKEGTKITNMAANKGVVRVKKLGYAINPVTQKRERIDVIASIKAVDKRKNDTQLIEALLNNLNGNKPTTYVDNIYFTDKELKTKLTNAGYPTHGKWECDTYVGKLSGVAGKVFWGVTKDVEDAIWDEGRTEEENNRGIRSAGLKFSTVELRALTTRFGGPTNPIIEEILSHRQGTSDIIELLKIFLVKRGDYLSNVPTIDVTNIKAIGQLDGVLMTEDIVKGTVADHDFAPAGFMLKLPIEYQVDIDENGTVVREGIPLDNNNHTVDNGKVVANSIKSNKIYVPSASWRRCWKHHNGKYGLSELCTYLNLVINLSKRYIDEPDNTKLYYMVVQAVELYYNRVSKMIGSKRGELAIHGMSVRYPHSAKGVATLGDTYLPKNTIEIGRETATKCNVSTGDIVLVERFPCLGFMSLRPQKVIVTDDPNCRYTIRVSSNSLASMGLDFDGDVIYIASFFTKKAVDLLNREWTNPNKTCYRAILELNSKMGKPHVKCIGLDEHEINPLNPLTKEEHTAIVAKAVGVKANTGPVVALAYNIMRVVENSHLNNNQKVNVAVEYFLDRVANSVFKEKHGIKSLHEIVVTAICTGDIETLVKEGFDRSTSTLICDLIKSKAQEVGVQDIVTFHSKSKSTILNLIVRKQNKIYFTSRSYLEGLDVLRNIEEELYNPVDIPSNLLSKVLSNNIEEVR